MHHQIKTMFRSHSASLATQIKNFTSWSWKAESRGSRSALSNNDNAAPEKTGSSTLAIPLHLIRALHWNKWAFHTWDWDMCANAHEHVKYPYSPELRLQNLLNPWGLLVLPRILWDISMLKSCMKLVQGNLPSTALEDNVSARESPPPFLFCPWEQ